MLLMLEEHGTFGGDLMQRHWPTREIYKPISQFSTLLPPSLEEWGGLNIDMHIGDNRILSYRILMQNRSYYG